MLTIDNHAPDMDAITIRDRHDRDFTISIYRDEDGKVHVIAQEHGSHWDKGQIRQLVLGRKTIKRLPNIDAVNKMRPKKPRKEPLGE